MIQPMYLQRVASEGDPGPACSGGGSRDTRSMAHLLRTIPVAAYYVDRHPGLIRRWVHTGRLTHTACDTRTRALLVDLRQVVDLSQQRQTRRPA